MQKQNGNYQKGLKLYEALKLGNHLEFSPARGNLADLASKQFNSNQVRLIFADISDAVEYSWCNEKEYPRDSVVVNKHDGIIWCKKNETYSGTSYQELYRSISITPTIEAHLVAVESEKKPPLGSLDVGMYITTNTGDLLAEASASYEITSRLTYDLFVDDLFEIFKRKMKPDILDQQDVTQKLKDVLFDIFLFLETYGGKHLKPTHFLRRSFSNTLI